MVCGSSAVRQCFTVELSDTDNDKHYSLTSPGAGYGVQCASDCLVMELVEIQSRFNGETFDLAVRPTEACLA